MPDWGLTLRMTVSAAIVFMFYVGVALLLRPIIGLPAVLAVSVLFAILQYWLGGKLALRAVDAEPLFEEEHPRLHRQVERLADGAGIEAPRLMVGDIGAPNAFVVGRAGAGTVVLSKSLLELIEKGRMSDAELEGILAHELAHLRNHDVIVMTFGQSIAIIVGFIGYLIVKYLLTFVPVIRTFAPILVGAVMHALVSVFVLVVSRYREYVADRDAAINTGAPDALADALDTITDANRDEQYDGTDEAVAALCLVAGDDLLERLLATHPPIEDRIERLRAMDVTASR